MRTTKVNNIIYVSLSALLVTIGFVLGKIILIPGVSIQREINPVHLLSILVAVLMGILASIVFTTHKQKKDDEKRLLISRIETLYSIADQLFSKVNEQKKNLFEINSINKRMRSLLGIITHATEQTSINSSQVERATLISTELTSLTTETKAVDPVCGQVADVVVEDNIVSYSEKRKSELESKIQQFQNALFLLQLEINGEKSLEENTAEK